MICMITILIFFVSSDICMGSDVDLRRGAGHEEEFKWTPELNAILVDIFHKTKSRGGNHAKNMKEVWDKLLPQFSNLKDYNLRQHAINVIYTHGVDKTHLIKWTPELESDLVEIYRKVVISGKKGMQYKLHDEFYKKHSRVRRLTPQTLWYRARNGYEKSTNNETEKMRVRTLWNSEHIEDATRLYSRKISSSRGEGQKLHEEWVKLHPEHRNRNIHSLQSRLRKVAKEQTGEENPGSTIYHMWNGEENAELLHVHHRVKPDVAGYSLRLHECWVKMQPDLGYMSKELLRQRVRNLLNENYQPTESEDERARVKYDQLFPTEKVRNRKREQLGVNKGKSKIDPAAEHPENMSLRLQELQPHHFLHFMSADSNHEGSLRNFDRDVQNTYMASSSQTPYYDPDTDLNLSNSYRGESSNPPSHQQPDPGASSPSKNTTKSFFNFF